MPTAAAQLGMPPPARVMSVHAERPSLTERTDEELATLAQGGARAAFGELVERFEGRLVAFLRRRTRSAQTAEELAQETFLRAWQSLARYRDQYRFSTWLFTIANRLAVDHYRLALRERGTSVGERVAAPAADRPQRLEELGRTWAVAERVLSEEQSAALWLRYGADLGIPDIAHVLGRTNVGVRVLLFRARERLAKELGASGTDAHQTDGSDSDSSARPANPRGRARHSGGA